MNNKIAKKIALCSVCCGLAAVTSCTDDYKNWVEPPVVPQPTVATFGSGSIAAIGTINLNDVTGDSVKVCSITAPTTNVSAFNPEYVINLGGTPFDLDGEGRMAVADLQGYVASNFGRNPNFTRTIKATVDMWMNNGSSSVKLASSGEFEVNAIAQAPVIEQAYYITGNINGWDNTDTTYKLVNGGGDVYADPIFTCTIPADVVDGDIEFKLTPESGLGGDWSKCITASDVEGRFDTDNAGGNIIIPAVAGAKFYTLSFDMLNQTYSVSSLSFSPFVYFIGATDGWSTPDQKLALTGDGVYTGYIYIADPNGWGIEFKLQRRAGDWADDSQLNSNNLNSITGDVSRGGDNIVAGAGEGVYFLELDLVNLALKGTLISNMNLVGDFNGWNPADDSQTMTWNAQDFCYEISGAAVTANGWKFTANNDWGINLGGASISDLVANGDNLSAVGTTIRLYPTRKTSDKIYCTVE